MKDQQDSLGVDLNRRRLTKASLATPAVLGFLTSRTVLGQDVPWNCTISGQVSGNVSTHEIGDCEGFGQSQDALATQYKSGSDSLNKDTLISQQFPNLSDYLYKDPPTISFTVTSHGAASIYDILTANNIGSGSELNYVQKALVLLLNSAGFGEVMSYPLRQDQAELIFKAAAQRTGLSDRYPYEFTWSYQQVKDYIDLLIH